MRRLWLGLTAILLVLAVCTACGGSKAVDLGTVMSDINSTYGLTDLKTVEDTDSLQRYYQIEPDDVKQFAAQMTTAASNYNEVILIEAVDAAAAENIQTQLNSRLRSQLSNAKSYDAEQVAMIEACAVKTNGNFVTLVIGDDHAAIEADIEKALQ